MFLFNNGNNNLKLGNERDTIIFRQLNFVKFKEQVTDKDYKQHKIILKTNKKLKKAKAIAEDDEKLFCEHETA